MIGYSYTEANYTYEIDYVAILHADEEDSWMMHQCSGPARGAFPAVYFRG